MFLGAVQVTDDSGVSNLHKVPSTQVPSESRIYFSRNFSNKLVLFPWKQDSVREGQELGSTGADSCEKAATERCPVTTGTSITLCM